MDWLYFGLYFELLHLIYPRLSTRFGVLVFFTNLSLMEFRVRYLVLFHLFSVIEGFEWFWMGRLHKNIKFMLEFFEALLLVLHFSYYTLMTFLMLSVILLSILMILLSTLSVIRHLICGAGSHFLISMLEKLNLLHLTGLITLVLLM